MRQRLTLGCVALLAIVGCDSVRTSTLPRPENPEKFLLGQRIKYDSGLLADSYWTVEAGEVSDFAFNNITENPGDKKLSATTTFRLIGTRNRGLSVQGVMRYHRQGENQVRFDDFTPTTVLKIGNW